MTITAISNDGASASLYTSATTGTKGANQQMNSQMFLQLLVTQLKTQDPSSPMDSTCLSAASNTTKPGEGDARIYKRPSPPRFWRGCGVHRVFCRASAPPGWRGVRPNRILSRARISS